MALTPLEQKLLAALKGAVKYFEYEQAFHGRLTARIEMDKVLADWKRTPPSSVGIGVGATYLSDATFEYEKYVNLISEAEEVK